MQIQKKFLTNVTQNDGINYTSSEIAFYMRQFVKESQPMPSQELKYGALHPYFLVFAYLALNN